MTGECIKFEFGRSLENLDAIFSGTAAFYSQIGLDESISASIDLVIEEFFANCVFHNPNGPKPIHIELIQNKDGIEGSISDQGEEFDPITASPPNLDATLQERKVGGLGIYLSMSLMDDVSYDYKDGVNLIRFMKSF